MKTQLKTELLRILLVLILLSILSCKLDKKTTENKDYFPIYIGKEIEIKNEEYLKMVPVIDTILTIQRELDIVEKLEFLLKVVSEKYFNSLEIQLLKFTTDGNKTVLHLNLKENKNFNGIGTLPSYESWYDIFQGSYGGKNTSIILIETVLQRNYKGNWIDEVMFYYQGKRIGEEDHISLGEKNIRYE